MLLKSHFLDCKTLHSKHHNCPSMRLKARFVLRAGNNSNSNELVEFNLGSYFRVKKKIYMHAHIYLSSWTSPYLLPLISSLSLIVINEINFQMILNTVFRRFVFRAGFLLNWWRLVCSWHFQRSGYNSRNRLWYVHLFKYVIIWFECLVPWFIIKLQHTVN